MSKYKTANRVVIRKSTAQTLTQSSTTLQNVTELLFAIGANEVWKIEVGGFLLSDGVADIKFAWSVPSGATGWSVLSSAYQGDTGSYALTASLSFNGYGVSTEALFRFASLVRNSTTTGNMQLQAAQLVGHASDTQVLANSFIIADRLA